MIGGDGDDKLSGSYSDDVLKGGAGNDVLRGDSGADEMTGGAGKDVFDLSDYSYNGNWRGDTITDFAHGTDKIQLGAYSLGVASSDIKLVVGDHPKGGSDPSLLFDTDTHRLWFDLDGKGGDHDPVLIATLEGVKTLTMSDFSFV